ncbi:MAG: molybdopterin-dependent oxidoreductase [Flavobacteriales bacterium]|nr:molybdopterin-dependent oxidoreductase [Flavobacteriales bacterium]
MNNKINRRNFLGLGVKFTAFAALLGSTGSLISSCATEVKAKAKLFHANYWGAFRPTVVDGKLTNVEPIAALDANPSEMLTIGVLEKTYSKTRVNYPLVRKTYLENFGGDTKPELRGKEPFVRVDWDTALGLVKKSLDKTIEEYGNEGILSTYNGWSEGHMFYPKILQDRFMSTIGGNTVTVSNYSTGAMRVLLPYILGENLNGDPTTWQVLEKNTELFVMVGCDMFKNLRIDEAVPDHRMYKIWEGLKEAGIEFLSIDPQVTESAERLGAETIKIIPNTDQALFLAMSYHLVKNELHNKEFLKTHAVGSEKYIAYLMGEDGGEPTTPEWASSITGLSAESIVELAELIASKKTQLAGSWSLQRASHGELVHWSMINFCCLLGNFGKPGEGVGFNWHYSGAGLPQAWKNMPGWMEELENPVETYIPASRITEAIKNPGKEFFYDGDTLKYPKLNLIYTTSSNLLSHHQDFNDTVKAMESVETIIVQDPMFTITAQQGDIILPATTTLERDDIHYGSAYSRDRIYSQRKVIEPVEESLDDWDIFRKLAALYGKEEEFTGGKTPMEWIKGAYAVSSGPEVMTFEEFWEEGAVTFPTPEGAKSHVMFGDYYNDPVEHALDTDSGKIEMYCQTIADYELDDCPPMPKYLEPFEFLGNAEPGQVHVVSPHPYNRLHSQLGNCEELHKTYSVQGREPVLINPIDAEKNGIADGDVVELYNDRGAVLAGAVVSKKIREGVVSLQSGSWSSRDSKGRCNSGQINFLTSDHATTQLSQATAANTCVCYIKKCEDVEGPNRMFEAPEVIQST